MDFVKRGRGAFKKSSSNDAIAPKDKNAENDIESDDSTLEDEVSDEELHETYNAVDLPEQNKSIVFAILKQFRPGMELKHVTLPAFALEPRSLLEKLTDFYSHPEILFSISKIDDPLERLLACTKFYISAWHVRPQGVRMALNPLIGERFNCTYDVGDSISHYVAEQISHHPPHTCHTYYNGKENIAVSANVMPSYLKFYGNWGVTNLGDLNEQYRCTLPSFQVRGLVFGKLVTELVGKTSISCDSSPFVAELEFKSKGMFKGKYNDVVIKIKDTSLPNRQQQLYAITGMWDAALQIQNLKTKSVEEFVDTRKLDKVSITLKPEDELEDMESGYIWREVVKGIRAEDEDLALTPKLEIEDKQRKEEKEREETGTPFIPEYYTAIDDSSREHILKDLE